MTETQWVPLDGRDLILGVRDILVRNPERHDQRMWLGNVFFGAELRSTYQVPVDRIREFMWQPIPDGPGDTTVMVPPCGSTGCAFGWAGVLSAPQGSFISNGALYTPDGERRDIVEWVTEKMGITSDQAGYMYAPQRSTEQMIAILTALADDIHTDVQAFTASLS
jgi:hypothetical protein